MSFRLSQRCPHCGGPSAVRTSKSLTPLYREATYQCKDPYCGFSWVVGIEALRQLSPSGKPNPAIQLPTGPTRRVGQAQPTEAEPCIA